MEMLIIKFVNCYDPFWFTKYWRSEYTKQRFCQLFLMCMKHGVLLQRKNINYMRFITVCSENICT